jgi:Holliday junction resolvasome RuvABC endonuclease subunit
MGTTQSAVQRTLDAAHRLTKLQTSLQQIVSSPLDDNAKLQRIYLRLYAATLELEKAKTAVFTARANRLIEQMGVLS